MLVSARKSGYDHNLTENQKKCRWCTVKGYKGGSEQEKGRDIGSLSSLTVACCVVILSYYWAHHLPSRRCYCRESITLPNTHITPAQMGGVNRCSSLSFRFRSVMMMAGKCFTWSFHLPADHFRFRWFIPLLHTIVIRSVFYFLKLENFTKIKSASCWCDVGSLSGDEEEDDGDGEE